LLYFYKIGTKAFFPKLITVKNVEHIVFTHQQKKSAE